MMNQMKQFVRSSENTLACSSVSIKQKSLLTSQYVSGKQIKQFYDNVVGEEALRTQMVQQNKYRPKEDKICVKEISQGRTTVDINILMKAVETGRIKDVQNILEQSKDNLNRQDQFGWTPLMSACCSGNLLMVQQLLQWNPDINVCDKRGYNCKKIASMKGYHRIVNAIVQYRHRPVKTLEKQTLKDESKITNSESTVAPFFYCKECKQNITKSTYKKHLSSTVHNFSLSTKRKMMTMYSIPESNKGFQIMVKSGWDKEVGLGPSGHGYKYPPKTILKQDRTGLGAKHYKARVTHRLKDVERNSKEFPATKQTLRADKIKGQAFERNLRRLLS